MKADKTYRLTTKEYKVLFDDHHAALCLFCNRYLNDLELAKDVVQEIFIKVWNQKTVFKSQGTVKSYLYTAVKNRSLDILKSKHYKSKCKLSVEMVQTMETDSFFTSELVLQETARLVDIAVDTLPTRCKKIIKLSLLGYKNGEIANELEITLNTVKAQKKIAYRKLRFQLREHMAALAHIFLP
ncbi:MAG: RNA polymerase sigma-70 factor [Muricauda sp.]|nr:RNA polymerase sigma-70 factor [uncultured Allomuricauda sp.]MAO15283.1 RNA polymerase sigma-70 factor [Allomuricauda sp.]MBC74308.1 RNA polymerase sigma-70 factor [Allomuricauda sp.]